MFHAPESDETWAQKKNIDDLLAYKTSKRKDNEVLTSWSEVLKRSLFGNQQVTFLTKIFKKQPSWYAYLSSFGINSMWAATSISDEMQMTGGTSS